MPDGAISGGYAPLAMFPAAQQLYDGSESPAAAAAGLLLVPSMAIPGRGSNGVPMWGVPLSMPPAAFGRLSGDQVVQQQVSRRIWWLKAHR